MLITPLLLAVLAQTAAPAPAPTPANTPAPVTTARPAGTFAPNDRTEPALPPNVLSLPDHGWMPLLNGENLDGWYTFRARDGKNNDVQHVFKAENGMIHVLDVPDPTTAQPNGYMATNEEFRNYRVRLEYKWGTVQFAVPRHPDGLPRDGGLLYHMTGPDQVWPMCVEFQIDEHTTGDVFLLPNNPPNPSADTMVAAKADGTPNAPARGNFTFAEGGIWATDHGQRIIRSAQYDTMDGWNTVELFATENSGVHVTNGHVNNMVRNLQLPNNGGPMTQGKILLQEENNELFYRKVEIKPLFADRFGGPAYKILVFSKTGAFRHASIPDGIAAIKKLGAANNFSVDATEDATAFTDDNLKQYKSIVFLSTTGDILNDAQKQAMINYIHHGGGFVGVHSASDTEYNWPWYGQLVGAYFDQHPPGTPTAVIHLEDPNHASTSSLPLTWTHVDEWYNFRTNPRANVHVLATVDESTFSGGTMGSDHPVAWCHDFEGGRSWYTALGHTQECYTDPLFLMHLLGGIMYASGTDGSAPPGATVLFDGTDTSHWLGKNNQPFPWIFERGIIYPPPATYPNGVRVMTGDIRSKETYTDFQLHVEFKVPSTNFERFRLEQSRGNSGVYLQGRYECQVLDSYDHPLADKNDEGAIYGIKDPEVNASLPPEVWQAYDITFHAAKWQDGKKIANARVTSYLNGVRVQNDTEIPTSTQSSMLPEGPEPGPIALQDHLNKVEYRYVWVKSL
jgi:type 1 glutamine amidotransferase